MQKAKLFINGRSQAVRLPKDYRFKGESVYIKRVGKAVVLFPDDGGWDMLFEGIQQFTSDFMPDGRNQSAGQEREEDPFC